MPQVAVTINGRDYSIACDEGQEPQVEKLARYVDGKVEGLVQSVGQIGEPRLLMMASLLIADELSDLREEIASGQYGASISSAESALAARVDAAARHIEAIAASLEAP